MPLFMDPDFIRCRAHLKIAKACGILVNVIIMTNCCARTVARTSDAAMDGRDDRNATSTVAALTANLWVKFSALSRCLNSSSSTEETRRREAILRVLRHHIELATKVAELVDPKMLRLFRRRAEGCMDRILNAVESTSAECEGMVSDDESAKSRLAIAREARASYRYYSREYVGGLRVTVRQYFKRKGYNGALVQALGSLFLMYREYASTGQAGHVVAGRLEHCLQILCALRITGRTIGEEGAQGTQSIRGHVCSV
ncbi:hypothetical protein ESP60_00265 [Anaplasma phagocytophilum]|nr:hypothetical protein ESP60_00265 [Anaplasma phagocytophilum]